MERKVNELGPKDRAWIDQNASRGAKICESYRIAHKDQLSPADLELAFKAWKEDRKDDK
jgi:hypothetical protein